MSDDNKTITVTIVAGDEKNWEEKMKRSDTVLELKKRITSKLQNQTVVSVYHLVDLLNDDKKTLKDVNIDDNSTITATVAAVKGSDWYAESTQIPLTSTPCSIGTCVIKNESGDLQFIFTCSHTICAHCLSNLIDTSLSKGSYRFYCPKSTTDVNGTIYCNKEISFTQIVQSRLIGPERTKQLRASISKSAAILAGMKSCPKCKMYTQRTDTSTAWTTHNYCPGNNDQNYSFCWWCSQDWKENSKICTNSKCPKRDPRLTVLENCGTINIKVNNSTKTVPNTRACPSCTNLQERDNNGCRYTYCPCGKVFCFICLCYSNKEPLPCGAGHWESTCNVADRQKQLK